MSVKTMTVEVVPVAEGPRAPTVADISEARYDHGSAVAGLEAFVRATVC